jgi:molybdopterin synthase sulfur carrier subunit
MEWKLFANLAEAAGDRAPVVEVPDAGGEPTVGEALDALVAAYPDLEPLVFDEEGRLRDHINVVRNGEPTDLEAAVGADDELALFPPVSGG